MNAVVDAVERDERQALADHISGACRASEWSCSHCETEHETEHETEARNTDYVFDSPLPFAPLTRVGLRALSNRADNGLEQLEALQALDDRRNRDYLAEAQPDFLASCNGPRRARYARSSPDAVRAPLSMAALDRAIARMEARR